MKVATAQAYLEVTPPDPCCLKTQCGCLPGGECSLQMPKYTLVLCNCPWNFICNWGVGTTSPYSILSRCSGFLSLTEFNATSSERVTRTVRGKAHQISCTAGVRNTSGPEGWNQTWPILHGLLWWASGVVHLLITSGVLYDTRCFKPWLQRKNQELALERAHIWCQRWLTQNTLVNQSKRTVGPN